MNGILPSRSLLPRLIRLRGAPLYLGMDRNRFNREVRPDLVEIPVGEQGIAFDRIDLDTSLVAPRWKEIWPLP